MARSVPCEWIHEDAAPFGILPPGHKTGLLGQNVCGSRSQSREETEEVEIQKWKTKAHCFSNISFKSKNIKKKKTTMNRGGSGNGLL